MFKIDYNPVYKRFCERNAMLSEEKVMLIQKGLAKGENFRVIKKTRREKKVGDVFICTVNGVVYYYGKILQANIKNNTDDWINGCLQVSLFKEKTTEKTLDNFFGNYDNLIGGAPFIITSQYWSYGWFETIGNIPLTEKDNNLDYGYYNKDFVGSQGAFYTAEGNVLNHFPKFFSSFGVTTLTGVYNALRDEIIIDPSLLEKD